MLNVSFFKYTRVFVATLGLFLGVASSSFAQSDWDVARDANGSVTGAFGWSSGQDYQEGEIYDYSKSLPGGLANFSWRSSFTSDGLNVVRMTTRTMLPNGEVREDEQTEIQGSCPIGFFATLTLGDVMCCPHFTHLVRDGGQYMCVQ